MNIAIVDDEQQQSDSFLSVIKEYSLMESLFEPDTVSHHYLFRLQ